jgi:hypothetical protein
LTASVTESKEREKIKVKIKGRHGFFYDDDLKQKAFCVSPQAYFINYKPTISSRFNQVSFGKGIKFGNIDCK